MVELIGATTTRTLLKGACAIDDSTYEKGVKVSDAEVNSIDITGDKSHPEGRALVRHWFKSNGRARR